MLRGSGGVLVRKSEKGCRVVKQTGTGPRTVHIGDLVGLVDIRMLGGVKKKVSGPWKLRRPR